MPQACRARPKEHQETATSERSKEDYVTSLTPDVLLFAPGTGILYSNFGFDLLAQALANAAGKTYADLLKERVLDPAGLNSRTRASM
jgi:D-alanyl-D-alanine-carboxypeptidase/D-alanyl-D-alanine-endopeptidase